MNGLMELFVWLKTYTTVHNNILDCVITTIYKQGQYELAKNNYFPLESNTKNKRERLQQIEVYSRILEENVYGPHVFLFSPPISLTFWILSITYKYVYIGPNTTNQREGTLWNNTMFW